jgi:adenylate cyclase
MKVKKKKDGGLQTVRFSIGVKLVTIITIIVLVSLGAITALVSWLVREDLRITAEANNFEVNQRSAAEVEYTLVTTRSSSRILMETIYVLGTQSDSARRAADYFFEQNPQIAALFFTDTAREDQVLINNRFMLSQGIGAASVNLYRENHREVLRRAAAGETILLNAAPFFSTSLLALFFPGWDGVGEGILFSPENLNDAFGFGTNQSWLINNEGDVLIHADFELVQAGANMADQDFIRSIRESPDRSRQSLVWFENEPAWSSTSTPDRDLLQQVIEKIQLLWENNKHYVQSAADKVCGVFRIQAIELISPHSTAQEVRYYLAYTKLNTAGSIVLTSIEYDKVFEGIAATTRRNIYLTAAVLSISIMLIWFFSKSISVPLKVLASAARTIEGGSFELDLKPKGRDEIGVLTASFNRMCTALGIFGRFTNRDIAVRAMRGEIKPGGLPKHATVFFSDIRSFTEMSENFTRAFGNDASDRIVSWLNEYFTNMVECVESTGGVVDKFIGDAVMAHWGTAYTAGSPRKDAFNCIKAALMMRMALLKMNRGRSSENWGNPPIRIGCGINTGIVTAGQIGSDTRMEYTVIGDPVNLASRTEALTKPLAVDILITEDTWKLIHDKIIVEEMPPVTVKGKKKPVRIFAVINLFSVTSGPRTLADVRKLLGISAPDIAKVDVNAEEKKYKIGGAR